MTSIRLGLEGGRRRRRRPDLGYALLLVILAAFAFVGALTVLSLLVELAGHYGLLDGAR